MIHNVENMIFVGLGKRVAALDRKTGEIIWEWKAPKGGGYVCLLLEGDRLIVSVSGYVYYLDARIGDQLWMNPMKGFGLHVTSIVSARGRSDQTIVHAAAADAAARAAAAGGAGGAG